MQYYLNSHVRFHFDKGFPKPTKENEKLESFDAISKREHLNHFLHINININIILFSSRPVRHFRFDEKKINGMTEFVII